MTYITKTSYWRIFHIPENWGNLLQITQQAESEPEETTGTCRRASGMRTVQKTVESHTETEVSELVDVTWNQGT